MIGEDPYQPSPNGVTLKEIPAKLERHALVDEARSAEGFVITEPSAIKRDSPDEHYGFEFVGAS
ncbi:hypothetical protein CS369_08160 [Candidatus Symbiopectobacterium sp. 'North America']|uniref:hypothetical protein n=1 Tax=Candidatus Symbiopectobacterium sp. 'North America' TaxID=2794574 RepID=UPI0018C93E4E|nr:hypothetical protein [Candidatus Symbiopectobacterium sp. 'North America']MBG6244748.1 hypothetical protein [Candidatus Symbiopectobacterium sp. 'North America']